ncbi:ankyrin [Hypoxylon crocopeplum]|nr:ankyrin [Hypoxylon crocopeplum]
MADPLSMAASIAGVLALAASTARALITLIQDISDAPEDILHIRRDVQNLSAVLGSIQEMCARYDLRPEEMTLVESLTAYLSLCQDSMQAIQTLLVPLAYKGSGRKSPMRMVGWVMRKGEIKGLRERLQEGKASLNITISALNGVLEGKGQEEIKSDVNKVYEKLVIEFRNRNSERRVRKRMEDDVASISAFGGRRQSISQSTDAAFPLNRFFDELPESSGSEYSQHYQSNSRAASEALLSPLIVGPTTLLEAVRARDKDGVVHLISRGCSPGGRLKDGSTALHFCAKYNDSEIAEILLDHGADINAMDDDLRSPLTTALISEAIGVANLFIQRGCSLTGCGGWLYPLTERPEEIPGLRTLFSNLAPKLNRSSTGPYLVPHTIKKGDTYNLELLLIAGFDANVKNDDGLPPLYQALLQREKRAVQLLLTHGTNQNEYLPPEARDRLNKMIPMHVTLAGMMEYGITPLTIASRVMRDVEMTRMLLEHGADPNFVNPYDGSTMLNGICSEEYFEYAKLIIEKGANVNYRDFTGKSPIYWANACHNAKLMELMLAHGGEVNYFYNDEDPTILFQAARWGHKSNAEILLRHGANWAVKNKTGKTAIDIARDMRHHEIVELLEQASKKPIVETTRLAEHTLLENSGAS